MEDRGRWEAGQRPGGDPGDRRVGVVWHTQGSGKSLTMAFYAGRLILHPRMANPTIVVLTDRNDLDDQLFGTFARCRDLLRQAPVQAASRADLREKLRVAAGGVVFTTIQKFFPEDEGDRHPVLSDRRNIVVIADEAHRSQYDFIDGFARHMRDALPHASFIGFTGTPIEKADANTRAVFGDYISVYDIQRAVLDGATVPIYYESRLAKLELRESERPRIDPHGFDWAPWVSGTPRDRLSVLPRAQEHILAQQDGKARLLRAVTELSQAFALAVPHEEALRIRDDVGFFQAVRAALAKGAAGERKTDEELDHAIRQIVSKAVASGEVGRHLRGGRSQEARHLDPVRRVPRRGPRHAAAEPGRRAAAQAPGRRDQVPRAAQRRPGPLLRRDLLEQSIRRYQNRAIETAQVIEELIALAKDMRDANARGESLGLTEDELAFYDALEINDSAVKVLGEPTLRDHRARAGRRPCASNVTIDWTVRENVRAQLRVLVKRILRKHGYPPDKQEKATQTVLEQAEVLSEQWAAA